MQQLQALRPVVLEFGLVVHHSMIVAYIFLRFAGSTKRRPKTAITLRVLAVLAAIFLAYAGYVGGGGQINPGALLAVVVTIAWASKQQFTRKTA